MRDTAGPYRLLERTGEDRLGDTYRARDTERGRTAFVRVVHPHINEDPKRRAALAADAQKAAAVSHPSVAALFDVIDEPQGLALAHEHVDGRTLAATLGGTPLNARLAVAIGIQVADGLAEVHAADLTHGAIDADHIAITPRGQAKLLDAGLTRWLSEDPAHTDDIAALGRLLSSMIGGHLPKAQWADDLRMAVARTQPGHPRRYESVATLAAELRAVSAMLEVRAEAAPRAPAGSGMSVLLWALLALVLLGLGAWFLLL
ncbi:MAG TPA: protein kinase [Vicinamibacterales bacterium]|nr:protein kinase [Vicinamibacterales bacterium]